MLQQVLHGIEDLLEPSQVTAEVMEKLYRNIFRYFPRVRCISQEDGGEDVSRG